MTITITANAHTGIPSYFMGWCHTASEQGSRFHYRDVGYAFAGKLSDEMPYEADFDEWQDELDRLGNLLPTWQQAANGIVLDDDQAAAVWDWFSQHYPRAMTLIPNARRERFVLGVINAVEDESITR